MYSLSGALAPHYWLILLAVLVLVLLTVLFLVHIHLGGNLWLAGLPDVTPEPA